MVALPGNLRENQTYIQIYVHWMYFIFIFAIPFLVLSLVNCMVIMTIRRARRNRRQLTRQQRKEHATATMMILVACAYIACTSLAFVLNAMELWGASGGREVELPPQVDFAAVSDIDDETNTVNDTLSVDSNFGPFDSLSSRGLDQAPKRTTRRHSNLFYFLIDLNNLLVMIHCSVNFLIYYKFNRRFRAHVKSLVCWRARARRGILDALTHDGTIDSHTIEGSGKPLLNRFKSAHGVQAQFCYGTDGRAMRFTYSHPVREKATGCHTNGNGSYTGLVNSPEKNPNGDSDRKMKYQIMAEKLKAMERTHL